MRLPRILIEAGALLRPIGDVGPSALIEEVELSHDGTVVEALIKRREGGVAAQNLCGQSRSLSRRGVIRNLDIVDDDVNDLRLGQLDLALVLILYVESQVILYVDLVFDV